MPDAFTRRIALSQTGTSTGAGNWTNIAVGSNISPFAFGTDVGLVFDFQTSGTSPDIGAPFDMATSMTPARALDPPVLQDLSSFPLDITVTSLPISFDIQLVTYSQFNGFSTSATPASYRTANQIETILTGTTLLPGGGAEDMNFDSSAAALLRSMVMGRSWWNGKIGIVLLWTSGGPSIFHNMTNVLWTMTLMRFFSGLIDNTPSKKARVVRDQRYGIPALSRNLVRDGDSSLWVHSFDSDPEDMEATYRPKDSEGSVNDGLPEG